MNTYRKKIIVIDAGIAGLAAAKKLYSQGFDVEIIEARSRIGGRISTDYSFGFPFDLGASFIHGEIGNPIVQLAQEYQIQLHEPKMKPRLLLSAKGQVIHDINWNEQDRLFFKLLEQAKKFAFEAKEDLSIEEAVIATENYKNLSDEIKALINFQLHRFCNYMGSDPNNLSARYYDQEQHFAGCESFILSPSYSPIIEGLAKGLTIHFNTTVTQINYSDHGVHIITESTSFQADYAILTVPLSILKQQKISFDPILPLCKQAAIKNIGMGLLDKMVLHFPKVFWPKDITLQGCIDLTNSLANFLVNFTPYYQRPILNIFVSGIKAKNYEKMTDEEILKGILTELSMLYNQKIPNPIHYQFTRWSRDPYSLGSYSYPAKGCKPEDFDNLAKPLGRILFAGEATSKEYFGNTHGAYLSGIREAERVCAMCSVSS